MPDYKESTIAGTKWTRCVRVVVDNPLGRTPTVTLNEEDVIAIPDGNIVNSAGHLFAQFDKENPLHVDIYTKLNELYVLLREARDNPPVVEPVDPVAE